MPQTSSCLSLCCSSLEKAFQEKFHRELCCTSLWTPSCSSTCSQCIRSKQVDGPFSQGRGIPPQERSSAQIPKSDLLGWRRCNIPAASSTLYPPLSQATETTKEAWQIGEERETSHFKTEMNEAVLFTCSGIHICFALFSMTTGCEQRSHREEH